MLYRVSRGHFDTPRLVRFRNAARSPSPTAGRLPENRRGIIRGVSVRHRIWGSVTLCGWGWGCVGIFWAFGMSTASLISTHRLSAAPRRPPQLQPPKSASGRSDVLQDQISPGRGPLIRFQHPGSTHWAPLRLAGRRVFPGALGLEGSSRPPGAAPADQPPRAGGRADSGGGARAFAASAPSRSWSTSLPSGTVSPQSSEKAPFFFVCFPLSPSDMLVKTEIFLLTFRAADGFVRV